LNIDQQLNFAVFFGGFIFEECGEVTFFVFWRGWFGSVAESGFAEEGVDVGAFH